MTEKDSRVKAEMGLIAPAQETLRAEVGADITRQSPAAPTASDLILERPEAQYFYEGFLSCLAIFEHQRDIAKASHGETDIMFRVLNAVIGDSIDMKRLGKLQAQVSWLDSSPSEGKGTKPFPITSWSTGRG